MTPAVWKLQNLKAGGHDLSEAIEVPLLEILPGEKVGFYGRDREGRSLLFRVMAGLCAFQEGHMTFLGHEMISKDSGNDYWGDHFPAPLRRKMGISLQKDGLLSNVSLEEGLGLLFRFRYGDHTQKLRDGADKVVKNLCLRFGLDKVATHRPFSMSPAEKRLGAVARAFLSKPQVVLLENPSQNMEDDEREVLFRGLEEIFKDSDRTVILSTGDRKIAETYCDRVFEVRKGKVYDSL